MWVAEGRKTLAVPGLATLLDAWRLVCVRTWYILHSDVSSRSFVKLIMLVFNPSFYAINQINQNKKVTVRSCICLFTTCMNFPVKSTVVIHFKAALLQKYFTLVQTEKTSFFSFRLKTRMSCYTGATQSSIIKTDVDRDIWPLDVAVSPILLPLTFLKMASEVS